MDGSQTSIETRSYLTPGERYHQPLRNAFKKIFTTHPLVPNVLRSAMAVKDMNDTFGPEGIIFPASFFGDFSQMRVLRAGLLSRPSFDE